MARFSDFFPFLDVHHCALAFALLFGTTVDPRELLAGFGTEHMALAGRFITWGAVIGRSLEVGFPSRTCPVPATAAHCPQSPVATLSGPLNRHR